MEEMTVKFKRIDTGKQWIAGSIKEGKYGPQIPMRKTPELQAYLDSVAVGGWLNFNLYAPYEQKQFSKPEFKVQPIDLSDSIPF